MTKQPVAQISLPEQLTSSVDLSRIIRELEALDESLRQTELRKPGEPTKLSRSSITLEELAMMNQITLTDKEQRTRLLDMLKMFHKNAPRIHMSLAAEPSANFTRKIVVWLRANVNPIILLDIGMQPTLAAGCMIRTSNKMFDMSLRHRFTENRHFLVEKISQIGAEAEAAQPVPVTAAPPSPSPAPQATPPAPAGPTQQQRAAIVAQAPAPAPAPPTSAPAATPEAKQ